MTVVNNSSLLQQMQSLADRDKKVGVLLIDEQNPNNDNRAEKPHQQRLIAAAKSMGNCSFYCVEYVKPSGNGKTPTLTRLRALLPPESTKRLTKRYHSSFYSKREATKICSWDVDTCNQRAQNARPAGLAKILADDEIDSLVVLGFETNTCVKKTLLGHETEGVYPDPPPEEGRTSEHVPGAVDLKAEGSIDRIMTSRQVLTGIDGRQPDWDDHKDVEVYETL